MKRQQFGEHNGLRKCLGFRTYIYILWCVCRNCLFGRCDVWYSYILLLFFNVRISFYALHCCKKGLSDIKSWLLYIVIPPSADISISSHNVPLNPLLHLHLLQSRGSVYPSCVHAKSTAHASKISRNHWDHNYYYKEITN